MREFILTDMSGKVLLNVQRNAESNPDDVGVQTIDAGNLANGIYFYAIITDKVKSCGKLIKDSH